MIASASSAAPAESLAAPLRWSEEPDHLWQIFQPFFFFARSLASCSGLGRG